MIDYIDMRILILMVGESKNRDKWRKNEISQITVSVKLSLIFVQLKYIDFMSTVSCIWYETILWWSFCNPGALESAEYPFIDIAPRSTVTQSGSTWKGPINGSNRTVWHLNWRQTKDLMWTELLEIEQFNPLNVCKQMPDV